jgi:ubiquinone/menaquinone biosynthesis C-methylase UbiE
MTANLAAARAAIDAFWDREGSEYDDRAGHGIFDDAEGALWKTALAAIPAGSRVLDIGTGTGFVAFLLAELGHRVTGVDASEAMLAKARGKAAECGLDIPFEQGATERLPFAEASFDAVTARHFTWTLLQPERAFAEWRRVLTSGATLVADCSLDPQVAGHHYSDDVAAALPFRGITEPSPVVSVLESAGFTDVDVQFSGGGEHRRVILHARAGAASR